MKITILEKGPFAVDGGIPMKEVGITTDSTGARTFKDGKKYDTTESAKYLCRCGHSANKPFCDGKHVEMGFTGAETVDRAKYNTGAENDPKVAKEINLFKYEATNILGPIGVTGGIQIVGSDGFEYAPKTQTSLCRCGASKNMPFCDGAHMNCDHMKEA